MIKHNIIKTLISKAGIVILNFFIVVCTTQFWGAEGRGIISIVMADLAIIVILNNIFSSSSISFYTPRINIFEAIIPAYLWIFCISAIATLFFSIILKHTFIFYLLSLTIITSVTTFNLAVFIGKEKLALFNFYNILIPLLTIILLIIARFLLPTNNINLYFWSYGIAYFLTWLLSIFSLKVNISLKKTITITNLKNIFSYGWKNELSALMQFLNYRFSYFIILYFLGIKQVGIFSIGIAIAESVWIISKSISIVQFSKILNTKNPQETISTTNRLALISLITTILIGLCILMVPASWFTFIFGKDFSQVKHILLLLYPGIICIAFSNVYGHFLAAIGEMKPLVLKSIFGLIATLLFSFLLIPKIGLTGACITNVISHTISSLYIYVTFVIKHQKTSVSI